MMRRFASAAPSARSTSSATAGRIPDPDSFSAGRDLLVPEVLHPAIARPPDHIFDSITDETLRSSLAPKPAINKDRGFNAARPLSKINRLVKLARRISSVPIPPRKEQQNHGAVSKAF